MIPDNLSADRQVLHRIIKNLCIAAHVFFLLNFFRSISIGSLSYFCTRLPVCRQVHCKPSLRFDPDYFGRNELTNGTEKLLNTKAFYRICIDEMYYRDFYAIERFGKTKLGKLLHYAKQGQNKILMDEMSALLQIKIQNLIDEKNREVQIMSRLKTVLNFTVPRINLKKVSVMIPIPQKALSKIEDRISIARSSIIADEKRFLKKYY